MKTPASMELQQTASRKATGSGFVLFGLVAASGGDKWFERWFESAESARKYASKRDWTVNEKICGK